MRIDHLYLYRVLALSKQVHAAWDSNAIILVAQQRLHAFEILNADLQNGGYTPTKHSWWKIHKVRFLSRSLLIFIIYYRLIYIYISLFLVHYIKGCQCVKKSEIYVLYFIQPFYPNNLWQNQLFRSLSPKTVIYTFCIICKIHVYFHFVPWGTECHHLK